jgi:FkbM family methyltransferase
MLSKYLLNLIAWVARVIPTGTKQTLYHLGPLSTLIRRMLNRASPQGLTRVRVAAGALAGMQFELDLQSEKDYWLGTYEVDLQTALTHFVKPGMVVYDLGANIGYISLMLALKVGEGGHVYTFEALPTNVIRLQKNLALNDQETRITEIHAAVVASPGRVQFLQGPSDTTGKVSGAAGREIEAANRIEVDGISLDDFIYSQGHPPPQLIKMDIEGGEIQALQGMEHILNKARPTLLLELHGPESAQAAWDTLTEAHYQIHQMTAGYPRVESWEALDWKAYLVAQPAERNLKFE